VNTPPYRFDAPRAYLLVSTGEPLAASAALSTWDDAPPDLCMTSPSGRAHDTAVFASAGHHVRQIVEPMLASRRPAESVDDFADRFAEAMLIVLAFDALSVLVVCDELPPDWTTPLFVDDEGLLRRAERLERELPLP
jgi:broad specificity phosphatase PhoE